MINPQGFYRLQTNFPAILNCAISDVPKFPPLAGNSKSDEHEFASRTKSDSLRCLVRNEMEYCVRLHCKPVKVKHCIQHAPEVETKRICTPTLSLSCLKSRQRRCQLEVGALGAENRAEFNQCMRRPSVGVL